MTKKHKGPKHPGVVLIKPDPAKRMGWRARFKDPDSGRFVKVRLDPLISTLEARADWAKGKSEELRARRHELASGAVRETNTGLSETFDHYFKAHPQLFPKTLEVYRTACIEFLEWAKAHGVRTNDDVNRRALYDFREFIICRPKFKPVREGDGQRGKLRGKRVPSEQRRSAVSINSGLRSLGTVLRYLIDRESFAHLTTDDVRKAFKPLDVTRELPEFLKPNEIRQLLAAVERHDAACFKMTRDEKDAGVHGPKGKTRRHEPIRDFILTVLLTGMRRDEARLITWEDLDLGANEIHLRGAAVKTGHARLIDLSVSPLLRRTLKKLNDRNDTGRVFSLSKDDAQAVVRRLRRYGAPATFTWQVLRSTCATYLTNAPGVFGGSSAYRSAKQLGHSVTVAEGHYVGLIKGIPKNAATIEQAMGIEPVSEKAPATTPERASVRTAGPTTSPYEVN